MMEIVEKIHQNKFFETCFNYTFVILTISISTPLNFLEIFQTFYILNICRKYKHCSEHRIVNLSNEYITTNNILQSTTRLGDTCWNSLRTNQIFFELSTIYVYSCVSNEQHV